MRMRILRVLLLATLVANCTGCALQLKDRRDAAWDPKGHQQLMDQIPAWEGAAHRICAGQLRDDQRRPGMSDRC